MSVSASVGGKDGRRGTGGGEKKRKIAKGSENGETERGEAIESEIGVTARE